MKKILKEFETFISKGNVIDLAIGVIIGGMFKTIVDSLVNDIIMPIIGILIGGFDFSSLSIVFGGAEIKYGMFIQSVVNLVIVGFTLFLFVKLYNKAKELEKKEEPKEEKKEVPEDIKLLKSINKELKRINKNETVN